MLKSYEKQDKNDTKNEPNDLAEIVVVWPELSEHIKVAIKVLVQTCTTTKEQE